LGLELAISKTERNESERNLHEFVELEMSMEDREMM
jgi:hypothetical protein